MIILPGLLLALALAIAGRFLSELIGVGWMGLPTSPVSSIMMAILLGIALRNLLPLSAHFNSGLRFCLVRVLRFGVVLLGIRLSIGEASAIGLKSLPVIIGCVVAALLLVTWLAKRIGLSGKLGTLIAVGTSICGATAIVATAPAITASDKEVTYAVACITLFGVVAMMIYPFASHLIFDGNGFAAGLFFGTAVHDTSQVVGAGLVYQQFYNDPIAMDVAIVTKLVRNLGMLIVVPVMCILYHRSHSDGGAKPTWTAMVPLFVIGFALMSLLRTVGDIGDRPFGVLDPALWDNAVSGTRRLAELCLGIAMAAVGLGTNIRDLLAIGLRPLGIGLLAALLVGSVSIGLISLFY